MYIPSILFEILLVALTLCIGLYYGYKIGFTFGSQYILSHFNKNRKIIIESLFDDYIKNDKEKLIELLRQNKIL